MKLIIISFVKIVMRIIVFTKGHQKNCMMKCVKLERLIIMFPEMKF